MWDGAFGEGSQELTSKRGQVGSAKEAAVFIGGSPRTIFHNRAVCIESPFPLLHTPHSFLDLTVTLTGKGREYQCNSKRCREQWCGSAPPHFISPALLPCPSSTHSPSPVPTPTTVPLGPLIWDPLQNIAHNSCAHPLSHWGISLKPQPTSEQTMRTHIH